jgi:H+/Cl- antiporter ClcA
MSPNGMPPQPPENLSPGEIWKIGIYAGIIAFLILFFGSLAYRAYFVARFTEPVARPTEEWLLWMLVFSLGGGVVVGTLAAAWRLINRRRRQPRWGTAVIVLAFVLFGLLVWPTPWSYRTYGCDVLQINRFIGRSTPIAKIPACEAVPATAPAPS